MKDPKSFAPVALLGAIALALAACGGSTTGGSGGGDAANGLDGRGPIT
jgi:multiple sugar transport system substrate-binding protein